MNYRSSILSLTMSLLMISAYCQSKIQVASLKQDGTIKVSTHVGESGTTAIRSNFLQLDNFPFKAAAHPNFKNFKNVSIADLNMDGDQEIIFCLNEILYALQADGSILWSRELNGTSNNPPAISDLDGDGDFEIALQTYGIPAAGNVYLFDHEGNLLEGWPLNINNNFFLNAITIADINSDGVKDILASERISSSEGRIHALNIEGKSISAQWPVGVNGTPAISPSVGDIDNDNLPDIITSSTTHLYAIDHNGMIKSGFPFEEPGAKFSYQSPILVDLNADSKLEIVGARHNDRSGTYVIDANGNYFGNWPDYDDLWTFAPPSVADIDGDGDFEVFFGRPFFSETEEGEILLAYDHEGNVLDGFPISGSAGSEGLIAIADVDNDGDMEIITSSKIIADGMGFIHAYHFDTQEEVENFPIRVEGFSYLNGAYLSDINNDGLLDLTALSYQSKFDTSSPDSGFVNVFNLEVPYDESTILFNGYKGSLEHAGLIENQLSRVIAVNANQTVKLYPNPAETYLLLEDLSDYLGHDGKIFGNDGKLIKQVKLNGAQLNVSDLKKGYYFLKIESKKNRPFIGKFIKL